MSPEINAPLNGWLLLDKATNISSYHAIRILKKALSTLAKSSGSKIKMGHAGTLDPFATGLLIVGIGSATKLMEYLIAADKSYLFEIKWGEERDTLDLTGSIVSHSDTIPSYTEIQTLLPLLIGDTWQKPPLYSAIKVDGVRSYSIARQGGQLNLHDRKVSCFDIRILSHSDELARTSFYLSCSKGFYVRSLARDIAHKLRTVSHVSKLRRIRISDSLVHHAVNTTCLLDLNQPEVERLIRSRLLPIDSVLNNVRRISLSKATMLDIQCGRKIYHKLDNLESPRNKDLVVVYFDEEAIGLCEYLDNHLVPKKVFLKSPIHFPVSESNKIKLHK